VIYTHDEIAALGPCWLRDGRAWLLRTVVGDGVTARQIAEVEGVSLRDRRWVLCHLLARGPQPNLRALVEWAAGIALDDAASITDEYDEGVARYAAELALRWSQGEDVSRGDLYDAAAARAAARAAAYAADAADDYAAARAYAAAYYYAAAYAADAARAAARAAAYAADAADYAADAADYAAQRNPARAQGDMLALAAILDGVS